MENQKIVLFQEKTVRRIWHNDEWHFSVIDAKHVLAHLIASERDVHSWMTKVVAGVEAWQEEWELLFPNKTAAMQ